MNIFNYDNEGVGQDANLTMDNDTTSGKDFTQTDLDNGLCACVLAGNNKVGMGSSGDKLFGGVINVNSEVDTNDIPVDVTVTPRGVKRFKYNTGGAPSVGQMVEVDGAGKVQVAAADADIAEGGHLMRGQVIAMNTTNETVDVWLG